MKIIKIEVTGITFDDGSTVTDYHDQDCCERVYADWKQLEDTDVLSQEFETIHIEGVRDSGIRLNGYFVPCYNSQNGYYGNNLEISIKRTGYPEEVIDVSEYVEDQID